MKSHELAKKLLAEEDVEVMFQDPNSKDGPYSVGKILARVAEKDEFSEDFYMPEGFKFIELTN